MNDLTPHALQVHLGYTRLTATSLGTFISALGSLADAAGETYAHLNRLHRGVTPTLEVEAAHTGESIKFTFGEGWLPSVRADDQNDLVIDVPKKLGIPALIGFLLLNAVKTSLEVRNEYLDGKLNQLEIILKEAEVGKLLQEPACVEPAAMQDTATHALNLIIQNTDYNEFHIYDVDVLSLTRGGHGKGPRKGDKRQTNNGTEPIR